jgi:hypothetical protein
VYTRDFPMNRPKVARVFTSYVTRLPCDILPRREGFNPTVYARYVEQAALKQVRMDGHTHLNEVMKIH